MAHPICSGTWALVIPEPVCSADVRLWPRAKVLFRDGPVPLWRFQPGTGCVSQARGCRGSGYTRCYTQVEMDRNAFAPEGPRETSPAVHCWEQVTRKIALASPEGTTEPLRLSRPYGWADETFMLLWLFVLRCEIRCTTSGVSRLGWFPGLFCSIRERASPRRSRRHDGRLLRWPVSATRRSRPASW